MYEAFSNTKLTPSHQIGVPQTTSEAHPSEANQIPPATSYRYAGQRAGIKRHQHPSFADGKADEQGLFSADATPPLAFRKTMLNLFRTPPFMLRK